MDDMWAAFAEQASGYALLAGGEVVGSCSLDDERRLLRFHVRPAGLHRPGDLLRLVLEELAVAHLMVFTQDPGFLGPALEVASSVAPHSLCFASRNAPEVPPLEGLVVGALGDHERIVDFEEAELGAPRGFLEGYVRVRLERGEMLLHQDGRVPVAIGELRRDRLQPGIAQLGVIVARAARGLGIGARMLSSLVARSRAEGLTPVCSTEVGNASARRAIERAGFRPRHRLLRVGFER